jgi:hypothetical protein
VLSSGFADIAPADNIAGRFISALFRFPKPGTQVPVEVLIEQTPQGERWLRRYPERFMTSFMSNANAADHTLEERFGAFSFRMKIAARDDGLDMNMVSARLGPLPLPRFLVPDIKANERVDALGRHMFDVSISLPVIGKIVRYAGWLALA